MRREGGNRGKRMREVRNDFGESFYYSIQQTLTKNVCTTAVPLILQEMRASVFPPNYKFIFSGLISLQEQEQLRKFSNTARLPITRYAEDLGATVVNAVDLDITHVVAKRSGTEKCQRGAAVPGCAVVSAQWLMTCFWSVKNAR